jgi:hypothetical protein
MSISAMAHLVLCSSENSRWYKDGCSMKLASLTCNKCHACLEIHSILIISLQGNHRVSLYAVKIIKSRRMRWTEYVACIEK